MKRVACVSLVVLALLLLLAPSSEAWGRGRVFIGVGPVWWGPGPWWYYPPYPVYTAPPTVVVQQPPVYVQQPPPAPEAPLAQGYWYYCASANAYYPSVPTCPEPWVKVPPRPE